MFPHTLPPRFAQAIVSTRMKHILILVAVVGFTLQGFAQTEPKAAPKAEKHEGHHKGKHHDEKHESKKDEKKEDKKM
jgi:Ni/Co efflux regulator RcnB